MLSAAADRIRLVPWSLALLVGPALSMLTLGYRFTPCLCGSAYGFPFATLRPSHLGATTTTIFVGQIAKVPSEIHLPGLVANVLVWTAIAAAALVATALAGHRFEAEASV